VAFPPAYKVIRSEPGRLSVETVGIGDMTLDANIMDIYRAEAGKAGINADRLLAADSYGAFLSEHLGHLVGRRYLRREWPDALARAARELTLADLTVLSLSEQALPLGDLPAAIGRLFENPAIQHSYAIAVAAHNANSSLLKQIPVMVFLEDWYRVRMGSDLGIDAITPDHLAAYRFLVSLYAGKTWDEGSIQASFGRLLRMFGQFSSGLPSRNFVITLTTGEVSRSGLS